MKLSVALVAASALALTACSRSGSDPNAFSWSSELPAGAVVHLKNGSGAIEIRRAPGQSAQISASRRWSHGRASDIRFVVSHKGTDYYVCAMWRNSGDCTSKGYRGNRPGFLSMFSLFHHNDGSADFVADIPANVTVDALTSNGSVEIEGVTAGVTARTSNGNVSASHVAGPLALSTSNGNVVLETETLSATDPINLQTKNGVIQANLPPGVEGNFDLSVLNGSLTADLPLTRPNTPRGGANRLQGQIGASTRPVKMRALNGSVVVRSRRDQG